MIAFEIGDEFDYVIALTAWLEIKFDYRRQAKLK
jgi:hypothetical protein